jgi:hypothetical protein
MDLTGPIQYFIQVGRAVSICFERLLPLTGFRAAESGVDRRILGFFIVVPTLIFAASRPSIAIPGLRGARVAGVVASMSQPAIFARTEAGNECSESCHSLRLFLTEVSGEPFVADAVFKCR